MKYIQMVLIAILSLSMMSACVSTTVLKSSPPGAKFYADGHYLGEGPVTYSDKKTSLSQTLIEIKKEGYADKTVILKRNEELNVGALVGGILLAPTVVGLLFFLWITDYSPAHSYDLEKAKK